MTIPVKIGSMYDIDWTFCLIADVDAAAGRALVQIVDESVGAGATLIQLRAKSIPTRQIFDLAKGLVSLLRPKHIPLIINDRIDIALASKADGVHLGQSDLSLSSSREILGKQRIIGISANSLSEAMTAEADGADYIGAGPVFPTHTKIDTGHILGIEGFKAIRKKVRIPLLAIGGIHAKNISEVIASGADGVAVISAVLGSEDVRTATGQLIDIVRHSRKVSNTY